MKKITYIPKGKGLLVSSLAVITSVLLGTFILTQSVSAAITATMGPGSSGANVTALQTYLASDPSLYPEGLVTGYYGALTQRAVERFQVKYSIVSSGSPTTTGYGRVGPATMAKLNSLIGGGTTSGDVSGPYLSSVSRMTTSTSTVFTWTTNENATARIYYGTTPVQFNEGDINSVGFMATSGQVVQGDSILRTSHSVSIPNTVSGTVYYYTLVSTDASGNVSVYGPNNTFRN